MIIFEGADGALRHLCGREDESCRVVVPLPEYGMVGITADKCIVDDLKAIWAEGVRTVCSCCGHGDEGAAFVCVVDEDADKMRELGYREIPRRYDHCAGCGVFFAPKGE